MSAQAAMTVRTTTSRAAKPRTRCIPTPCRNRRHRVQRSVQLGVSRITPAMYEKSDSSDASAQRPVGLTRYDRRRFDRNDLENEFRIVSAGEGLRGLQQPYDLNPIDAIAGRVLAVERRPVHHA